MSSPDPMIRAVIFALCLWCASVSSEEGLQPRRLVDAHTAGVLPRASYDFETRIYPAADSVAGTGLVMGIAVGVTDRLNIGVSYGGEGLVGRGRRVRFNPFPGVLIKYRLFEENFVFPGIAIGYDYQGFGGIADSAQFSYKGYVYKSPGFFLALSKNYLLFTALQFGFHGAATFSMEELDRVRWPNGYVGMDLGFNDELTFVVEYDLALNVRDPLRAGKPAYYARPQDGFLNMGLRWAFAQSFYIEFDAKDLFEKRQTTSAKTLGWSRELKLIYFSKF